MPPPERVARGRGEQARRIIPRRSARFQAAHAQQLVRFLILLDLDAFDAFGKQRVQFLAGIGNLLQAKNLAVDIDHTERTYLGNELIRKALPARRIGLLFVAFIVFSPTGLVGVWRRLTAPLQPHTIQAAAMAGRSIEHGLPLPEFLRPSAPRTGRVRGEARAGIGRAEARRHAL